MGVYIYDIKHEQKVVHAVRSLGVLLPVCCCAQQGRPSVQIFSCTFTVHRGVIGYTTFRKEIHIISQCVPYRYFRQVVADRPSR